MIARAASVATRKAPARRAAAKLAIEARPIETKRAVVKGLRAYNRSKVGKHPHGPLTVSLREGGGAVVGGLIGEIWLNWLYVSLVWIDEKYRGGGAGSRLIRMAEAEARQRGVKNIYLDSFTFQAPDFYKKLGYREYGRLEGFPPGHDRVFLTKAL